MRGPALPLNEGPGRQEGQAGDSQVAVAGVRDGAVVDVYQNQTISFLQAEREARVRARPSRTGTPARPEPASPLTVARPDAARSFRLSAPRRRKCRGSR